MVKIITQETFNASVQENMTLFGLEGTEAIRETIEQFTSQGVELSNIIKEEWCVLGGEDPLSEAIANISPESASKTEGITNLISCCNREISIRLKAGELGAYGKLMSVLEKASDDDEIKLCLDGFCALMDGFPDLLDKSGVNLTLHLLRTSQSEKVVCQTLEWGKICSFKHESNRKRFITDKIDDALRSVLERFPGPEVLVHVCSFGCSLCMDDDVRETASGAHLHAVTLAETLLPMIVPTLETPLEPETSYSVLKFLTAVLVRDSLCLKFRDLGGLDMVLRLLSSAPGRSVLRQGMGVLSCLAGQDDLRDAIVRAGVGPQVASWLWRGQDSGPLCAAGLSLTARLCLRSPNNSRSLYNNGLADCIIHIMKTHRYDERLLSSGCLALRNMVSHCHELRPGILALGAEKILENIPKMFPRLTDNVKATLLALDCKVHLKEEWTGVHGDKLANNR